MSKANPSLKLILEDTGGTLDNPYAFDYEWSLVDGGFHRTGPHALRAERSRVAALPDDELFDPAALAALRDPDAAAASALARAEGAEQGARSIFSFPLLREGACERLVREVEAYEAHCAARGAREPRPGALAHARRASDVAPELAEPARAGSSRRRSPSRPRCSRRRRRRAAGARGGGRRGDGGPGAGGSRPLTTRT